MDKVCLTIIIQQRQRRGTLARISSTFVRSFGIPDREISSIPERTLHKRKRKIGRLPYETGFAAQNILPSRRKYPRNHAITAIALPLLAHPYGAING